MKFNLKSASLLILTITLVGISTTTFSRDVKITVNEETQSLFSGWFSGDKSGVAAVNNPLYLDECGSCHFAYQPGLLPIASWEKIMSSLDNHFGENAELADEERAQIRNYLLDSAAGRTNRKISVKFIRSLRDGQVPLRISEIPYFIHEHDELSRKMVQDNPEVKSFSRCDACHSDADKGIFDEDAINIPGFGRWEDD
ncbi:MAG: diheme cytochrome c [Candidatus Polarisedimenticolaceae bacterium]|nr:diheme cytochrome c [Candidatus Polarisedimenticolaceae bacterium]